jgi:anti-sigma B factor antagonist
MALKLSTRTAGSVTIVYCNGRIVFGDETAMLRDKIKGLLSETRQIVLNLGGVSYIDSGGLGTLVGLYTSARGAGGDIKLANLTKRVDDQLQITKLVTIFEVYEGEDNAIAAYQKGAPA